MIIGRSLAAILLILLAPGVSDAWSAVNLRLLIEKVSPSPTPDPSPKSSRLGSSETLPPNSNQTLLGTDESNSERPKVSPVSLAPPPALPGEAESGAQQVAKSEENDKKDQDLTRSNSSTGPGSEVSTGQEASCGASSEKCQDADLVACLQHSENESEELFLIIQNEGANALNVNITVPTSVHIDVKSLQLAKHVAQKIGISTNATGISKIVVSAGKGDCILHIWPSFSTWFQQFPVYATRLTPVYGAYFMFCTIVIAGGTWACCKFGRKARRGDTDVPYQQLEMGGIRPQSSSVAIHADTAVDGWDQGWDDDWDEETAVSRPPEEHPAGHASSNGLSLRSPKEDGWDMDWDD